MGDTKDMVAMGTVMEVTDMNMVDMVKDMAVMVMDMVDMVMDMVHMVMIVVMPMKITRKVKKALVKKMTKDMVTTVIKKGLDMVTVDIDLATVDTGMVMVVTDMAMDMADTELVILMDIKEAITDHKRVTQEVTMGK